MTNTETTIFSEDKPSKSQKGPFFHEKIQKKTGTKIENEAPQDPQIIVKKRNVKYQIKQHVCVLEDQHWKNYFVWRATK